MVNSVTNNSTVLATQGTGLSGTTPTTNNGESTPARETLNWAQPQTEMSSPVAAPTILAQANGGVPKPSMTELAKLAANVYGNDTPPAGFRIASPTRIAELGLTSSMLNPGGDSQFRAQVYVREVNGKDQYVIAMRGTRADNSTDWGTNFQQAAGASSDHYTRALEIGKVLARRPDTNITITGHSLGGGLAAATAIASGHNAVTFNAAGLHRATIDEANLIQASAQYYSGPGTVTAFNVRGDGLNALQDKQAALPDAYGNRVKLPAVAPAGSGDNAIARHGMDWVLTGLSATGR
jgi:hypothetical protein